jgi:hypothetical protein
MTPPFYASIGLMSEIEQKYRISIGQATDNLLVSDDLNVLIHTIVGATPLGAQF